MRQPTTPNIAKALPNNGRAAGRGTGVIDKFPAVTSVYAESPSIVKSNVKMSNVMKFIGSGMDAGNESSENTFAVESIIARNALVRSKPATLGAVMLVKSAL